jgi:hypothetical protein
VRTYFVTVKLKPQRQTVTSSITSAFDKRLMRSTLPIEVRSDSE